MKQDIEKVSNCLETERLDQLEKQGKLGVSKIVHFLFLNDINKIYLLIFKIPNDFLFNSCKCKKPINTHSFSVNTSHLRNVSDACNSVLCKCDIDISSIENFFFKLGMPMYLENVRNESINVLFEMSPEELEKRCDISNKIHLDIIYNSIKNAKKHSY